MVVPHLVLAGYIEAMRTALSSNHPVFAWLAIVAAGNTLAIDSMPPGGILYTFVLAVAISGMLQHKSKVTC